jgi:hypothetical protein
MLAGGAHAAEIKIVEVKAHAFLGHAGKPSDDLLSGPGLVNPPTGGVPAALAKKIGLGRKPKAG